MLLNLHLVWFGRSWSQTLLRLDVALDIRDLHQLRLHVDLKHFPEEYSVLVLNFTHAFLLLHFFLVVCLNVSRSRRLVHIDTRLHIAKSLHMKQVVFDLFTILNVTI